MKPTLLLTLIMCCLGTSLATVPDVAHTVTYTCTGGFGPYPFSFPISTSAALTVTLNDTLLVAANYTVVPVNNNYANGGSVTLGGSFPCTTGTLVLTRVTPITQTTHYYDNMPTPFTIFGNSLDKLTEIAQELADDGAGASIQMQNDGVDFLVPSTGLTTFNFTNCTVGGEQDNYTIECAGEGGSGTVTGPGSSTIGHVSAWGDSLGTTLADVPVAVDSSGNISTSGTLTAAQTTLTGPPYGANFIGFNSGTPTGFGDSGSCALYTLTGSPKTMQLKCDGGTAATVATGTGSDTNAVCWKGTVLSYCTSVVASDGTCTCH